MRSASSAYRISFTCTLIELLDVIFACSFFFSGSYIIFIHIVIHWLKVFFPLLTILSISLYTSPAILIQLKSVKFEIQLKRNGLSGVLSCILLSWTVVLLSSVLYFHGTVLFVKCNSQFNISVTF